QVDASKSVNTLRSTNAKEERDRTIQQSQHSEQNESRSRSQVDDKSFIENHTAESTPLAVTRKPKKELPKPSD
ncbi:hypothetical protein, partial [Vibrio anguillarum]